VARLIAKAPLEGVAPVEAGETRISACDLGRVTWVAPLAGKTRAVSTALKAALGLSFPGLNKAVSKGEGRIIWAGREQALLVGVAPPEGLEGIAALTDQTDGIAAIRIEGSLAQATLARLVPVDLGAGAFGRGATARTMLGHMTCSVTRLGAQGYEVLVFRSMARTALHELTRALKAVAARG